MSVECGIKREKESLHIIMSVKTAGETPHSAFHVPHSNRGDKYAV